MTAQGLLQTDYAFTLPCGYVDEHGNLHREGIMRLATTRDEIEPLGDPRVKMNQAYISVLLLSRVISRIGEIRQITPSLVEQLYAADFVYLQDLYVRINDFTDDLVDTECPEYGTRFTLNLREQVHG